MAEATKSSSKAYLVKQSPRRIKKEREAFDDFVADIPDTYKIGEGSKGIALVQIDTPDLLDKIKELKNVTVDEVEVDADTKLSKPIRQVWPSPTEAQEPDGAGTDIQETEEAAVEEAPLTVDETSELQAIISQQEKDSIAQRAAALREQAEESPQLLVESADEPQPDTSSADAAPPTESAGSAGSEDVPPAEAPVSAPSTATPDKAVPEAPIAAAPEGGGDITLSADKTPAQSDGDVLGMSYTAATVVKHDPLYASDYDLVMSQQDIIDALAKPIDQSIDPHNLAGDVRSRLDAQFSSQMISERNTLAPLMETDITAAIDELKDLAQKTPAYNDYLAARDAYTEAVSTANGAVAEACTNYQQQRLDYLTPYLEAYRKALEQNDADYLAENPPEVVEASIEAYLSEVTPIIRTLADKFSHARLVAQNSLIIQAMRTGVSDDLAAGLTAISLLALKQSYGEELAARVRELESAGSISTAIPAHIAEQAPRPATVVEQAPEAEEVGEPTAELGVAEAEDPLEAAPAEAAPEVEEPGEPTEVDEAAMTSLLENISADEALLVPDEPIEEPTEEAAPTRKARRGKKKAKEAAADAGSKKAPKTGRKILIAAGIVVVVIAVLGGFIIAFESRAQQPTQTQESVNPTAEQKRLMSRFKVGYSIPVTAGDNEVNVTITSYQSDGAVAKDANGKKWSIPWDMLSAYDKAHPQTDETTTTPTSPKQNPQGTKEVSVSTEQKALPETGESR